MKYWKVQDLQMLREDPGYNVHDYFPENPATVAFRSREGLKKWMLDKYLGTDEYGVGVGWNEVCVEGEPVWHCSNGDDSMDVKAPTAREAAVKFVEAGDETAEYEDVRCTLKVDGRTVCDGNGCPEVEWHRIETPTQEGP